MRRDEIIDRLKTYQRSAKNPHLLRGLTTCFLAGINPRVHERHGKCAKHAVEKVLEAMFVVPLHPQLCLDAMLQLCRDDPRGFLKWQDAELIERINSNTYFNPLTLDRLFVETQDGVV